MGRSRVLSEISKFLTLTMQGTLQSKRVPLVFREPGVLSGYRPCGRTWGYYFCSVFKFHNETVNIWTHAVACLILTYKMVVAAETYTSTGDDTFWLLSMFGLIGLINCALSSFAHTFHSKSLFLHYLCFQADYAGIALLGLVKSILFFHTSCSGQVCDGFSKIALPLYVMLSLVAMTGNCVAKLRYRRPYPPQRKFIQLFCGLIQALAGSLPITSKYVTCILHSECAMTSLNHHSIWLLTLVICLFFFSSHLPEKKYPGYFDCIGQGHQIFHVFISITLLLEYDAALYDAQMDGLRPLDKTNIILATVSTIAGGMMIIVCLLKFTKQRVESDRKDT